jgi:hypothetical protein
MFDSGVCCRFGAAPSARVDLAALSSLQALLNEVDRSAAVLKAQHHSTVFGGSDAEKPHFITDSAANVSGDYSETAVAGQCQATAPRLTGQATARRKPVRRKAGRSAR